MSLLIGEKEQIAHLHAEYYMVFAEAMEQASKDGQQEYSFQHLEEEQSNLRCALQWALDSKQPGVEVALRLGNALTHFWMARGYLNEGKQWLERILNVGVGLSSNLYARTLCEAGWLASVQGNFDQAAHYYQRSLSLYDEIKDAATIAQVFYRLGWLSLRKGQYTEALMHLKKSRDLADTTGNKEVLAYSLYFLAAVAIDQGRYSLAYPLIFESLALFRILQNKEAIAGAYRFMGRILFAQGNSEAAYGFAAKSRALCREIDHKEGLACSFHQLGRFAYSQGNFQEARTFFENSLLLFKELGAQQNTALVQAQLASIATLQDDLTTAHFLYEESIALCRQGNDRQGLAFSFQGWGALVAKQGHQELAAHLWGAAEVLCEGEAPRGLFLLPVERIDVESSFLERAMTDVCSYLGEQAFANAWLEGKNRAMMQLHAYSSHLNQFTMEPHTIWSEQVNMVQRQTLTRREMEVLHLIAQGLTDAQVAASLVISRRTVNVHLRSIYRKLNITSRTAAMYYALSHNLL